MDVTNRIAAVVFALLIMFLAFLVIMLAWGAPDESIKRIADLSGYLSDHNTNAFQALITFGALIVMLLGLTVIIFELAPPDTGSVKVAKVGAGDARIGTDEISERLHEELRSIPHLQDLEVQVRSRGNRADLRLELYVDPGADLTQTASEACTRAREIVEGRMGVELDAPPKANVHFGEGGSPPETHADRQPVETPPSTPSWRPAGSPAQDPIPASVQPASSGGTVHEASPTAHEDQPSGA
jgi:hypothetical protein